jgi:hypothetical protein
VVSVVSLTSSSGGYINGRNSANLELLIDKTSSIYLYVKLKALASWIFLSFTSFWRNSDSYEYKNKSARRGLGLVTLYYVSPKWPCDILLIMFYLNDHVSYSLLCFTYMTMWAILTYFLPRWPCELLFIMFYLYDHVSYFLVHFGPGELLPSLGVRHRSSVNFSHFKLLLRNCWADWNQT